MRGEGEKKRKRDRWRGRGIGGEHRRGRRKGMRRTQGGYKG